MRAALRRSLLLSLLAASPSCALRSAPVTRIVDGVEVEGRAISDEAYAAYARAATLEAAGDDANALVAYREALDADAGSAEILARIGALQCRLAPAADGNAGDAAEQHFSEALRNDPESYVAWLERARCQARRGKNESALAAARQALRSDPASTSAALLIAALCERTGDLRCATTWLDGVTTMYPERREAWSALADFARRRGDAGRALRARAGLEALGVRVTAPPPAPAKRYPSDLPRARRLAMQRGASAATLALELVAQGDSALARKQAELVLDADPENTDAWIALLAALDLEGDAAQLARAAQRVPLAGRAPSPLAAKMHAELLARLVDAGAARAWLSALSHPKP